MTNVKELERRVEALDHDADLPGWMRGMECFFGKFVILELLRLAQLELAESKTPEEINEGAWRKVHAEENDCLREALQDREWFMQNGKVEDALHRLCDLQGEITVESIEQRRREVLEAIEKQEAYLDRNRPKEPLEVNLGNQARCRKV